MIAPSVPTIDDGGLPQYPRPAAVGDHVPYLVEAFWAYEQALMRDDQQAMTRLFAPGEHTLRGDAAGLRISHEQITGFRAGRGGAPKRRIVELHVRQLGEGHACTVAVTELLTGGRGQQTQVWERSADLHAGHRGWQCTVAHVMTSSPAFDRRIWRVVGDPLVPAVDSAAVSPPSPLAGESIAVKDLFAVKGQRIGAGSPAYLEQAAAQPAHAEVVQQLLEAGAQIRGIASTDEFAYSLAGTNTHYGVPPNPAAPLRVSGGSSSGSASAVANGHASIGLGTDTGGSVRVPAAYQGLFGIRTTHGAVSSAGLLPLAQSFDTVGWLTRSAEQLEAAASVLLPQQNSTPQAHGDLVVSDQLIAIAETDVAHAVRSAITQLEDHRGRRARVLNGVGPQTLSAWVEAFTVIQGREAWANHGTWVSAHWDRLAPDIASRFRRAAGFTPEDEQQARSVAARARSMVREWVGDGVLALPSSSSVAPLIAEATAGSQEIEQHRQRTLQLTCVAGLAGLPVVSIPLQTASRLPAGLSLVGPAGSDVRLTKLATSVAGAVGAPADRRHCSSLQL